jgi:hypothetical protein
LPAKRKFIVAKQLGDGSFRVFVVRTVANGPSCKSERDQDGRDSIVETDATVFPIPPSGIGNRRTLRPAPYAAPQERRIVREGHGADRTALVVAGRRLVSSLPTRSTRPA